jgi:hypothetical protein
MQHWPKLYRLCGILCIYSKQPALNDFNRDKIMLFIDKMLNANYVLIVQGAYKESGNLAEMDISSDGHQFENLAQYTTNIEVTKKSKTFPDFLHFRPFTVSFNEQMD